MPLSDHVTLVISQDSAGISRAGFGVPAILSHKSTPFGSALSLTYTDLSGMVSDGWTTDDVEYLAASAIFSQDPHPPRIKIIRAPTAPTQTFTLTPAELTSHTFRLEVGGEGVTPTEIEFTSGAGDALADICDDLVSALNAVTGKNFTATDGDTEVTVDGDSAGDWFYIRSLKPGDIAVVQDHTDPGLASELSEISLEDDDWYCLLTFFNSEAYVDAAADWINARSKIYLAELCDTDSVTASGSGAIFDLSANNWDRVALCYHDDASQMFAAAWAGKCLPFDPGSITWKFKTLSGVRAVSLTSTHRTNLTGKQANSYETVSGLDIAFDGKTSDGDYLDVRRGLDWLHSDMSTEIFAELASSPKVPFTDSGIARIQGRMLGTLQRAVRREVLSDSPEPYTTVPRVSEISSTDKGNRHLPDMKAIGTLAGAVHTVGVTVIVQV